MSGELAWLVDALTQADGLVPGVLTTVGEKIPVEFKPQWDELAGKITAGTDPAKAAETFAQGFAGVIKTVSEGHGPPGHHSVHGG